MLFYCSFRHRGCLLNGSEARAEFLFVDVFNGVTHLTVTDNSANDINPDPNPIIVRSSALLAAFGTKIITGRSVSASSNLATAAADGPRSLLTQFTFGGKAGQTSNFTVTAGHMGYTVPGDPKTMNTSASLTVTNSGAAGTGSFQGSVGTTNGPSNAFDALIATTSAGNAPNSSAGSGAGFIFSNGSSAYSVQNVLKAPIVSTKNALVQGQGTTVSLSAVPEPATIVMLGVFRWSFPLRDYGRPGSIRQQGARIRAVPI